MELKLNQLIQKQVFASKIISQRCSKTAQRFTKPD
jgi:hypothetical protein